MIPCRRDQSHRDRAYWARRRNWWRFGERGARRRCQRSRRLRLRHRRRRRLLCRRRVWIYLASRRRVWTETSSKQALMVRIVSQAIITNKWTKATATTLFLLGSIVRIRLFVRKREWLLSIVVFVGLIYKPNRWYKTEHNRCDLQCLICIWEFESRVNCNKLQAANNVGASVWV